MKDLIKEVALEGAEKFGVVADDSEIVDMVTWCLAELSKRAEAVAICDASNRIRYAGQDDSHRYASAPNGMNVGTKLFTFPPIHDIEAIENRVAEACAKLCDSLTKKEKEHAAGYGPGYLNYTAQDISDLLNSGEWRKYK